MLNFLKNAVLSGYDEIPDITETETPESNVVNVVPAAYESRGSKVRRSSSDLGALLENEKATTIGFSIFSLFRCLESQRRYVAVFAAYVFNFIIGGYAAVGNFIPYMASYLTAAQLDFNVTSCDAVAQSYYATNTAICSWLLPAFTLGYAGCGFFGGLLQLFWSTRSIVFLGGSLMTGSFIIAYYHSSSVLVVFLCGFGVMYGVGCGLSWGPSVVCALRWFPNAKGLMSGIIISAFPVGSICFSMIETKFINPSNAANDPLCGYALQPGIYEKLPVSFLLVAVLSVGITAFSTVFISDAPPTEEEVPIDAIDAYIEQSKLSSIATKDDDIEAGAPTKGDGHLLLRRDFTVREALSSPDFWIIFFNMLCMVQLLCWTYTNWKLFAETYVQIEDDSFLLQVNMMAAACNLFGRLVWGNFYDRIGSYKKTIWINSGLSLLTIVTLPFCTSKGMTLIWVSMLWFCTSATYTIMAPVLAHTFGDKYCAMLTGVLMIAEIFSTGLQSTIFTVIERLNIAETSKWDITCFVNGAFTIIALIITCWFKDRPQTRDRSTKNVVH